VPNGGRGLVTGGEKKNAKLNKRVTFSPGDRKREGFQTEMMT